MISHDTTQLVYLSCFVPFVFFPFNGMSPASGSSSMVSSPLQNGLSLT